MANIKVELANELINGQSVTFIAPCDCSAVTGLIVYYPGGSKVFAFKDAHGNELTGLGNLFSKGAYVKAVLDTVGCNAYLQNADTNKYLEDKFASHYHGAEKITGGTFSGPVLASNSTVAQPHHVYLLRNQKLSSENETPTVNGTICWQYK